jgi:hypothetical protein
MGDIVYKNYHDITGFSVTACLYSPGLGDNCPYLALYKRPGSLAVNGMALGES